MCQLSSGTEEIEKPLVLDVVGEVRKPGRISLASTDTVGRLFELAGATEFASSHTILIFRVSRLYTEDMISGDERRIIELKVVPTTVLGKLDLKPRDVIYVQQKRPVGR